MHPQYHEYVEKLKKKLPEKLNVVYLVNSGSEANELAFLIAKLYTGAQEIISLQNGYHGGTLATQAATGLSVAKYPVPQAAGFTHVKFKCSKQIHFLVNFIKIQLFYCFNL